MFFLPHLSSMDIAVSTPLLFNTYTKYITMLRGLRQCIDRVRGSSNIIK